MFHSNDKTIKVVCLVLFSILFGSFYLSATFPSVQEPIAHRCICCLLLRTIPFNSGNHSRKVDKQNELTPRYTHTSLLPSIWHRKALAFNGLHNVFDPPSISVGPSQLSGRLCDRIVCNSFQTIQFCPSPVGRPSCSGSFLLGVSPGPCFDKFKSFALVCFSLKIFDRHQRM